MPDSQFPQFSDGRRAPRQPVVKCWNILESGQPKRYHWLSDDIKVSGLSLDHMNENTGEHLGGYSGAGARKGTLEFQLDNADDLVPLPGHVVSIGKGAVLGFYRVEENSAPVKGKDAVRGTLTLTRIINPFFTGLLSEAEGDILRQTFSIATMGATETITTSPVNHRTGSTKLYEMVPTGDSLALPAGVAINATTGVITVTKASVAVGVYEIDVTAKDTLAPYRELKGGCRLTLTITA